VVVHVRWSCDLAGAGLGVGRDRHDRRAGAHRRNLLNGKFTAPQGSIS
jgi:hypothetical protein